MASFSVSCSPLDSLSSCSSSVMVRESVESLSMIELVENAPSIRKIVTPWIWNSLER